MSGGAVDPVTAVDLAMHAVERRRFLPRSQQRCAGVDLPLRIGLGQTNSQPSTVRRMLELLEVPPGCRVLDVGAGSGWTTALLAHLVGPSGCVIGVELEARLAVWAEQNVRDTAFGWARVEVAVPGRLGWPDEAPYDRILVSAEATTLPAELVGQLGVGGVLVVPVAGRLQRVRRPETGGQVVEEFGHYRFVPLR